MTLNNVVDVQLLTNARLFVTPWLQHARHPCPSPSPGVCSNSCPLRWWYHPTISSSVVPSSSCPSIFPSIRVFSNESAPHIRWPKYWSFRFSISPSDEYSGLISFGTDWFDLLAVQGTLKSFLQHHSSKAAIFDTQPSLWSNICMVFFMITSVYDCWKNHNFDYADLCWQSDVSAF